MKIFSSLVCIFCFFIAASKTTLSDDYKSPSENWLKICTTPDAEWISYCNGYIQGVIDSFESGQFCPKPSTTRTILVTLVTNVMSNNHEFRDGYAFSQIRRILLLTYPCS